MFEEDNTIDPEVDTKFLFIVQLTLHDTTIDIEKNLTEFFSYVKNYPEFICSDMIIINNSVIDKTIMHN